jgi:hypothetical protein
MGGARSDMCSVPLCSHCNRDMGERRQRRHVLRLYHDLKESNLLQRRDRSVGRSDGKRRQAPLARPEWRPPPPPQPEPMAPRRRTEDLPEIEAGLRITPVEAGLRLELRRTRLVLPHQREPLAERRARRGRAGPARLAAEAKFRLLHLVRDAPLITDGVCCHSFARGAAGGGGHRGGWGETSLMRGRS